MYIKFLNSTTILEGCILRKIKQGVIRLYLSEKHETPYVGFRAYLDRTCTVLLGNYDAYRTKYKDSGNEKVLYLSTGETYTVSSVEETVESTQEELEEQEKQQNAAALWTQIEAYKAKIDATDYRIIKAYEYSIVGLESEYDMQELHAERQDFRDIINRLEEELQKINRKGDIQNE